MKLMITILFSIKILMCNSEVRHRDVYGKEYNEMRKQNQIPLIQSSWTLRPLERPFFIKAKAPSNYSTWFTNECPAERQYCHEKKTIYYDDSGLIAEEDTYIGSRNQQDYGIYGNIYRTSERIDIIYVYKKKLKFTTAIIKEGWNAVYIKETPQNTIHQFISLIQADSLLNEWHINRLNY